MTPRDDIFAVTEYAPRRPTQPHFKPWHKPRKQYVRREQWAGEVDWLLTRPGSDQTFKYLGLPGADLLDLRYLYTRFFAGPGGDGIYFLGFDESARPGSAENEQLNISLRELRDLPNVDSRSDVYRDDIRLLASADSLAWATTENAGPFDLINLDLCGHLTGDEPALDDSIYNVIHRLMGLQRYQRRPWSLLLTTRLGPDGVLPEVRDKLYELFRDNLMSCTPFKNECIEHFDGSDYSERLLDSCSSRLFVQVIGAAVCKWLQQFGIGMQARLSVQSVVGYRVYGGSEYLDMLSFALRFEPVLGLGPDPARLATLAVAELDECYLASAFPRVLAQLIDVDGLILGDHLLRDEMIGEMAQLLESARYDAKAYLEWVARGIPTDTEAQ